MRVMRKVPTRVRAVLALGMLVIAASAVGAGNESRASGQTGGGQLGPDYVRATAADLGTGSYPGGAPLAGQVPSDVPVYVWNRIATPERCVFVVADLPPAVAQHVAAFPVSIGGPYAHVQVAPAQAPPGAVRYDGVGPLPEQLVAAGDLVLDHGTASEPGLDTLVVPRCVAPGAPLPTTPPTAAEIWEQTPLPRARIRANPPGSRAWPGVVHLQSRFWADPLPAAVADVVLDGYVVDVRAVPVAYAWVPGDGTSAVRDGPGSPTDAVPAEYRRRGDYPVTLYVMWAGVAHTSAPALGLDFGSQWLGTATLPERVVHHVAEIRALLHS
jgi:hypothetical protein